MDLAGALRTIDQANSQDPNLIGGEPLARHQGQRAAHWVSQLATLAGREAPTAAIVAGQAHHLRRWEVPRSSYPEGRPGYLKWRRDAKIRHAEHVDEILVDFGFAEPARTEVADLIQRKGLGSNPDTQLVEDAACLVFLETQYDDMIARLDHDHMVTVVARTLKKMSPLAIEQAAGLTLSPAGQVVLADAVAEFAASN